MNTTTNTPAAPVALRLVEQLHQACAARHYSDRTASIYWFWAARYIRANDTRHPADMGPDDVCRFLADLYSLAHVSAATQAQARAALLLFTAEKAVEKEPRSGGRPARRVHRREGG